MGGFIAFQCKFWFWLFQGGKCSVSLRWLCNHKVALKTGGEIIGWAVGAFVVIASFIGI